MPKDGRLAATQEWLQVPNEKTPSAAEATLGGSKEERRGSAADQLSQRLLGAVAFYQGQQLFFTVWFAQIVIHAKFAGMVTVLFSDA